jgi:tripartite-type tricarboxylate transporter receptor subunit TctC
MEFSMNMKSLNRRQFNSIIVAAPLGLGASHFVNAQPQSKIESLRIYCGYAAGNVIDIMSRKVAEKLTGRYASQVVVENKAGAAGRIAVAELKRAATDGSAMLIAPASAMTLYPHVFTKLNYEAFNDFVPVASVASTAFALAVGPKVPTSITNLVSFIAWCKANPREASCANAGIGSLPHFLALLVARESGLDFTHIPYPGTAMPAAAAGETAAAVAAEAAARPLVEAGKLRVLATTGRERSALYPSAQTFVELGWNSLVIREWFGAFMPARTPSHITNSAASAVRSALQEPDLRETWAKASWGFESMSPEQIRLAMRQEYEFWGPVVKTSGVKLEG